LGFSPPLPPLLLPAFFLLTPPMPLNFYRDRLMGCGQRLLCSEMPQAAVSAVFDSTRAVVCAAAAQHRAVKPFRQRQARSATAALPVLSIPHGGGCALSGALKHLAGEPLASASRPSWLRCSAAVTLRHAGHGVLGSLCSSGSRACTSPGARWG
jgi:hypothetical protein